MTTFTNEQYITIKEACQAIITSYESKAICNRHYWNSEVHEIEERLTTFFRMNDLLELAQQSYPVAQNSKSATHWVYQFAHNLLRNMPVPKESPFTLDVWTTSTGCETAVKTERYGINAYTDKGAKCKATQLKGEPVSSKHFVLTDNKTGAKYRRDFGERWYTIRLGNESTPSLFDAAYDSIVDNQKPDYIVTVEDELREEIIQMGCARVATETAHIKEVHELKQNNQHLTNLIGEADEKARQRANKNALLDIRVQQLEKELKNTKRELEKEKTKHEYNGWSNYETWFVNLYYDTNFWYECLGYPTLMGDYIDNMRSLVSENWSVEQGSVPNEVIRAFLDTVNWYELAAHVADDAHDGNL